MNGKKIVALTLDLCIVLLAVVCAVLADWYVESSLYRWLVWAALVVATGGVLLWEYWGNRTHPRAASLQQRTPSLLALIGDGERELRTWPLGGKVGLLVGKSRGETLADIDLATCSWSEAIDEAHLAVNYADGGWWAQDLSSRNGSALVRDGKEILLTAGWPVRMQCGDTILLAGNIRLAVQ